jgi:histone H3/H4
MAEHWKTCGSCKKPIAYNQDYWVCSVSSCNRARYKLVFCKLSCWDAHVPLMNHRNAWAEERRSPPGPEPSAASTLPRLGGGAPAAPPPRGPAPQSSDAPSGNIRRRVIRPAEVEEDLDILIVASRLKKYIKDQADMNTSADALEALSDIVRRECRLAIQEAKAEGRKTVKGRDFRQK